MQDSTQQGSGVCKNCHSHKDMAFFILRLAVGIPFIYHGYMKVENMPSTIKFFQTLGFMSFFAYLVAWGEFIGGMLVILGIFTTILGTFFAIEMAVVVLQIHSAIYGKSELELGLMFTSLALAVGGPGRYSLKHLFCKK